MISCCELLEEYSDFRDGLLEPHRSTQFESHLEECPSCASYDRVVSRGVSELRRLPEVESSCDFLARLQHRIYHLEDDVAVGSYGQGSRTAPGLVALLVGVIGAAAWIPAIRPEPPLVELPPIAAVTPAPAETATPVFFGRALRLPPPAIGFAAVQSDDPLLRYPTLRSPHFEALTISLGGR